MALPEPHLLEAALEAVETLAGVQDAAAALATTSASLARFGFSAFILSRLPPPRMAQGPQILLNGWPEGWTLRYTEAGHYDYDPVARYCMASDRPFVWSDIPAPYWADAKAGRIAWEASTFDLNEGLCVPLHTPLGSGGLSLAGSKVEAAPGLEHLASLLAHSVCAAVERVELSRVGRERLTIRERDILAWVAHGRTVGGIAEILGISEHTVGEHLKHIRQKLGSANNAQCVVRALQLGQLRL